jgi:shikimate dehydrogenase
MSRPFAEVIGDPIAHSKSPLIHRFWIEALGLDAEYCAVQVPETKLANYLHERRSNPDWRGCNVTMPLKRAVVPFVASLDYAARTVQAVNTIVHRAERRIDGYNTDVTGVAEPLRARERITYPNHVATYVQIIGAGGAARAAALGASQAGYCDFDVFNRSIEKAHELAALIGAPFDQGQSLDTLGPIRNPGAGPEDQRYSHVIINATSMGMLGQPAVPINLSDYHADTIVFDMVYSPLTTPLLSQARAFGLRVIDGLEMLIAQASKSFELFFGAAPPRERDGELRALLTA